MSIRTRLDRLERLQEIEAAEYCHCDGDGVSDGVVIVWPGAEVPDVCPMCGKTWAVVIRVVYGDGDDDSVIAAG